MIPESLLAVLQSARSAAVLTGAGVSAESGIPTFRDALSGLWSQFRPEELASPEAFMQNPRLVWEWYAWRRSLVSAARPNPGHYALAEMEKHIPNFTLITQNVDGLHRQAGSQQVVELHGNIQRIRCFDENIIVESWEETGEVPPRCPACGGMLRPDVVWFGETLPVEALESAFTLSQTCQVFFSIGTSGLVQPAASLPYLAKRAGAVLVEVNPEETPLTAQVDYFLKGTAGSILPALVNQIWNS